MTGLLESLPASGHLSWWLEDVAGDARDAAAFTGEGRADVAIIGGGYVGLWSAIELKLREPSIDVAVLEALTCGSGASGRNGGFAMSWWSKMALFPAFLGDDESIRLGRASADGLDEMEGFLDDHAIECDFLKAGWIWTAASEHQRGAWKGTLDECRRLGISPFRELPPSEVARRTGSAVHIDGVFDPDTARVHPAKLVRGLRRVALEMGVRLFENSPVTELARESPARIRTPGGSMTAHKAVVATNAWAAGMPEFRRAITAISSDMVITEPIPDRLQQIGWTGGECVSDSQTLLHYYQTTADGRVAFGQAGGTVALGGRISGRFDRFEKRAREVERSFRRLYPMLADVKVAADWAGPIDRGVSGLPIIGHTNPEGNIVHALGWSGNGVGPSRVGGKFVASLVQERDDAWTRSPLVDLAPQRFPVDPARFLGSKLVRAAVAKKERAELAGRRPGRAVKLVAAQVPTGLIPKDGGD